MTTIFIDDSAQSFNVPLESLRAQHPGKRLVVGVAITTPPASGAQNASHKSQKTQLLLLQRAETENVYPLMYEIPGGGAEQEDSTLIDTVVRETTEETGLSVSKILGTFPGFEYETAKSKAIQFNFLVEVDGNTGGRLDVRLNSQEHCRFAWIDREDLDDMSLYPMTKEMRQVVLDALTAIEGSQTPVGKLK